MEGASMEMPKYRSHKIVCALAIAAVATVEGGFELKFADEAYAPMVVNPEVLYRHYPQLGDYLVVYPDGYQSISPKKAFEEEYAKIGGAPIVSGAREHAYHVARIAHEVNRAYARRLNEDQPEWHELGDEEIKLKIEGVNFVLANPGLQADELHDEWVRAKMAAGWTHGQTLDREAKTHPCMVPLGELPEAVQTKDYLFRAVVLALA